MKKLFAIVLAVVMLASLSGVALAGEGNALPSGDHYNLNLIGKDKTMPQGDDCSSGNRIFVNLNGRTKINLVEGDEFAVTDCDGTGGNVAEFTLPNPDPDNNGVTEYSVFLRLRGKPNGNIIMTTCGTYIPLNEVYCSDLSVVEVRETGNGKNSFNNVSAELLYIYAWVCTAETAGECTNWVYMRVPLFADQWEGFFWELQNDGTRLVQLRFYEGVETRVPGPVQIAPRSAAASDSVDVVVPVTITAAAGVNFASGTVTIDAGDLTVGSLTRAANTITTTLTIPEDAATGKRLIWITQTISGVDYVYLTSFEVK